MIWAFLFAFCSTVGFCILFHVPKKHIASASFVGACGWLTYTDFITSGSGSVLACFAGSCVVALISDLFSRTFKEAATIFIIPGILPLVPGANMYYTMLAILEGNVERTASVGTETILMAGSIAVALLVVSSVIKLMALLERKIMSSFRKEIS
ncbi:MAG TPA: threonine/serine exporter family protein [Anaerovoracaceae bacterium]|nr:threonine/serine exporter family protein [Anaerovoracaceae bacterium]